MSFESGSSSLQLQTKFQRHYIMVRTIELIGAKTIGSITKLGEIFNFLVFSLYFSFTMPLRLRLVIKQIYFIGNRSLTVIIMTGLFTGMVLGIQGYHTLAQYGSEAYLGSAVALSLIRELGPVLAALMVTGRAGSAITAEIGVMKITDQIDALKTMDIDPIKYLISPKIIAGIICLPVLCTVFDLVGIGGGYLVGIHLFDLNSGTFFASMESSVTFNDIWTGYVKSFFFGLIIVWICSYKGYTCQKGAEGVGLSTTEAVVTSSVLILISDYILTTILFQ